MMWRAKAQSGAVAERRASRRDRELVDGWRTNDVRLEEGLLDRLMDTAGAQARPRVTVVIPALNEAANLPHVLPRLSGLADEVILVDGDSTDGTWRWHARCAPTSGSCSAAGPRQGRRPA